MLFIFGRDFSMQGIYRLNRMRNQKKNTEQTGHRSAFALFLAAVTALTPLSVQGAMLSVFPAAPAIPAAISAAADPAETLGNREIYVHLAEAPGDPVPAKVMDTDTASLLKLISEGLVVLDESAEVDALVLGVNQQHPAKQQEERVHEDEDAGEGQHIALRVLQVPASQVLLHHILVKAGHDDGDEHAADDLFQEVVGSVPIGFEHFGVAGILHLGEGIA